MEHVTVADAARRLLVTEQDIEELAGEGLLSINSIDGVSQIPLQDIQALVKSMPQALRERMGKNAWQMLERARPDISAHVNERFTQNLAPLLERAHRTVEVLEKIHSRHEPAIDIFNDRRGSVAAFILCARLISLHYSALALLRSASPSETVLLFRPIWEAALLVRYFAVSEARNENGTEIRRWFENEESPKPSAVRDYVSKHLGIPIDGLRTQYNALSKAVHLTYQAVMESYRAASMTGFLGTRMKRLGFDYRRASVMRDIVEQYLVVEQLLLNALLNFRDLFAKLAPLEGLEASALESEIQYYQQDFATRVKGELARSEPNPSA